MKFGIMFANGALSHFRSPSKTSSAPPKRSASNRSGPVEHVARARRLPVEVPYSETGKMPGPDNVPIPDPISAAGVRRCHHEDPPPWDRRGHSAATASGVHRQGDGDTRRAVEWACPARHRQRLVYRRSSRRSAFPSMNAGRGPTKRSARFVLSWKETPEAFEGKFFKWDAVESQPKPVQKPGVPIIVGGHADAAVRRAARYGDGFFPARGDHATLARLLGVLRDECLKIGRKPEDIELRPVAAESTATAYASLSDPRRVAADHPTTPSSIRTRVPAGWMSSPSGSSPAASTPGQKISPRGAVATR